MLKFDAETLKILEDAYQGDDVRARRQASFDALAPRPGDRILDLGCGNGLLTLDLVRTVGAGGHVTGLDPSPDMLQSARDRCTKRRNAALVEGDANDLPFPDNSFDKIVSLQVFEYFSGLEKPLDETLRVLRTGGRLVVGDMHWDSLIWQSEDPGRMQTMIRAWDDHLAHRRVPEVLPAMMRERGFSNVTLNPLIFLDIDLRPDGLAQMLMHLMTAYASQNNLVSQQDIDDWAAEQQDLAGKGRFFFSISHFVCSGTAP